MLEEVGCPVDASRELGEVVEYRNDEKMGRHSFCYIANQAGDLVNTLLEESEIEEDVETVIANDIDEAISLLENDVPTNYEGHFIRLRDLRLSYEAKSALYPIE